MKTLIVLAIVVGLVGAVWAQDIDREYEVGAVLLPYLNMTYVMPLDKTIVLWSQEIPGNYTGAIKFGTNKYRLTWQGVTYQLSVVLGTSNIIIRRLP